MFTTAETVAPDDAGVRTGGALRLAGPGDPAALDPACVDDAASAQLVRLYSRQLFTYRPEPDVRHWRSLAPLPDLAAQIPSIYNAGLGASGTTYVVHLRPGSRWDTEAHRPVTTHDVIRGLKRLANPLRPVSVLPYLTSTIRGMAGFVETCHRAFAGRRPSAADLAAFQHEHDIPGVFALDDESLVFELVRPTLDFINMLALPAVAPAPQEYDAFLPDSPELRRHLRSSGPYRVARYEPSRELVLEPNPAWQPETDPVRRQYLDRIELRLGVEPGAVAAAVRAGEADLPWNAAIPASDTGRRPPAADAPLDWSLDPFLVFNLRSPNAGGALRDVRVRRAIAAALDRDTIAQAVEVLGSGAALRLAGDVVPPGHDGHTATGPEPGVDLGRAQDLLAEAGYADGLVLTAVHPDDREATLIARCYAADLARAGVTVRLAALPRAQYRALLADPGRAAAGEWDLTTESLSAAWRYENGRVFVQRLFASTPETGTGNVGGYREPEVDQLIEAALGELDPRRRPAAWAAVARRAMQDQPIVPILFRAPAPQLRGAAVRGAVAMPSLGHHDDLATVWLAGPDDEP
jgi:peptide/nickel transport system substrate-binding protein